MSNLFENFGRIFTDTKGLWDDITGQSTSKEIAEKNLAFQRENLEYQKELQKQIFEREDTAYQRTASDMLKAGMNPLSMNGTNGAGEAIMTSPLNLDNYSRDSSSALMEGIGHVSNIVNSAFDNASKVGVIKAQKIKNERDQKNLDYMNKYGLNDMSPEWLRSATAVQSLIDSKQYLSMIESAKKLGKDLTPELKNLFENLVKSTESSIVNTVKDQINANYGNKYLDFEAFEKDQAEKKAKKEAEKKAKSDKKKESKLSKSHDKAMRQYVGYQYKNSDYYKKNNK